MSDNSDTIPVTWETYVRAETDTYFDQYVEMGGFGEFYHYRTPVPIDEQFLPAEHRDVLVSIGVFDLTEPVTITKPDTGDRYQSMHVLNEDQYTKMIVHEPGEYTLTQDENGTRYVCVRVRTFVDPNDPDDVTQVQQLQDEMVVRQSSSGTFEVPDWDQQSLEQIREALKTVAHTLDDSEGAFGDADEVHPMKFLLGCALGWGGLPTSETMYIPVVPDQNDGETPHVLTFEDVPVDGFWDISVYNIEQFFEKNEYDAYSINSENAERNADGSVTIHFGGDPDQSNFLYTPEGWNYIVRFYQPHQELLDGSYQFPEAEPVGGTKVTQNTEAENTIPVTWENFPRAQFELFCEDLIAEKGGFGEFYHYRNLTPVEDQETMPRQPNRDTLYSIAVFDLTEPVTITKPDTGDRYQSIEVDDQDQYQKKVLHAPGEYTLTRDEIGTRYVALGVRTFVDPTDPDDLQRVHRLQDEIAVSQDSAGTFEISNWDRQSFEKLREALATVGKTVDDLRGAYGDVDEVNPVMHLLASAVYKWGGLSDSEALYLTRTPEQNDGETPHTLTVEDVPVDGFWSVTVYNRDLYLEKNEYEAYSVNNVTAARNADGSVTVHFGGDPDQPNFLYTPEGWNYVVRLYRPHEEILDGSYQFPEAEPVK